MDILNNGVQIASFYMIQRNQLPQCSCNDAIQYNLLCSLLQRADIKSTMKIANLMDLPPVVLIGDLFINGSTTVYYPQPLLKLWMKSIQPPHDSASGQCYSLFILRISS
jgi:hypothetical protein